jgi:hypothetical protein
VSKINILTTIAFGIVVIALVYSLEWHFKKEAVKEAIKELQQEQLASQFSHH